MFYTKFSVLKKVFRSGGQGPERNGAEAAQPPERSGAEGPDLRRKRFFFGKCGAGANRRAALKKIMQRKKRLKTFQKIFSVRKQLKKFKKV